MATRVSWSLHHGKEWPVGLFALHHCDNSICVNPEHVFPGTLRENVLDALGKGRKWGGNSGKTHCKRGHAFDSYNTLVYTDGKRHCRVCRTAHDRTRSRSTQ